MPDSEDSSDATPQKEVPKAVYDVFISFAPEDSKVASKLALEFKQHGLRPIWAETEASPSEEWSKYLERTLEQSRACVFLLSPATASPSSALSQEWTSIIRKSWERPDFPCVTVKLDRDLKTPPFLWMAESLVLPRSRGAAYASVARKIADAISASPDFPPSQLSSTERNVAIRRFGAIEKAIDSSRKSSTD